MCFGIVSSRASPEFDSLIPTIEDFPSPLSGDQLCKGAAAILNKKPTKIIIKPKLNPCSTVGWSIPEMEFNK